MASLVRQLLDRAAGRPRPADTRPYRRQSEPGPEKTTRTDTARQVWRQVGWLGQSGAFYALDERPSETEAGSFSPLWFIARAERIDDVPELPRRGDAVEAWLKRQRDSIRVQDAYDARWVALLDELLDAYRLHADTGTPLHEHCCEGGNVDDCAGCYDAKVGEGR